MTTVFNCSFIQTFAAKFEYVWMRVIATIRFTQQTNLFSAAYFFFEEARTGRLSCLLCLVPQVGERKFVVQLAELSSVDSAWTRIPLLSHFWSGTMIQILVSQC